MADARKALIVATDQYGDPKLTRLNAPAEDARALAEVLKDPDVGAYEVETVLNKTCQEVEIAIASFFQAGARGDTLLLHFSCHGVKDLSGELYFATTDTKLPLLKVTAVSSSMVKTAMEESRASLILCLVDCCYSGAFTKSTKAAATVDLTERLGGRGRAVITASTSLQLALDGKEEPSLFTHAVVEGLRSGEADRDLDGLVTLDEFYNYVHEQVTAKNPDQTPVKSFDVQGEVYVARRGGPISTPAPLPKELSDTLAVGEDWQRMGAVSRLTDLLNSGHPGRALAARLELERVRDNDDSNKVRRSAAAALETAGEAGPMPTIPTYTEQARPRTEPRTERRPEPEPRPDVEEMADTRSVDTDAVTHRIADLPVGEPTEGVVSPTQPEQEDDDDGGGRPARRWGIPIAAALSVAALIVAGWAVVNYTGDDSDGRDTRSDGGGDGGDRAPVLSDSEMLVAVTDADGIKRLRVVNVESGESRILKKDVGLPTIAHDRKLMAYLQYNGLGDVPYLSSVNGRSGIERLLQGEEARGSCPFSGRPSQSSDGGAIAMVCKDESNTVIGLFVTRDERTTLTQLAEDAWPSEGPTWEGQDNIVFVSADFEDGQTILRRVSADGGDSERITDGTLGWDTHPDWSDAGLLFLRSPDGVKQGDVWRLNPDGSEDQLTTDGIAQSPTWSPDAGSFAFLAPASEDDGSLTVWVQDARVGAAPTEITITDEDEAEVQGKLGPPAWGAR
jgi:hypothetical protein